MIPNPVFQINQYMYLYTDWSLTASVTFHYGIYAKFAIF